MDWCAHGTHVSIKRGKVSEQRDLPQRGGKTPDYSLCICATLCSPEACAYWVSGQLNA